MEDNASWLEFQRLWGWEKTEGVAFSVAAHRESYDALDRALSQDAIAYAPVKTP